MKAIIQYYDIALMTLQDPAILPPVGDLVEIPSEARKQWTAIYEQESQDYLEPPRRYMYVRSYIWKFESNSVTVELSNLPPIEKTTSAPRRMRNNATGGGSNGDSFTDGMMLGAMLL